MKAVLGLVAAFATGALAVYLARPSEGEHPEPHATTAKPTGEADAFDHEADYGLVEVPGTPFAGVDVELVAEENRWLVGYRGTAAGPADLAPDGTTTIRLPSESCVRLTLGSRDYVYLLALPKIGRSQVAVPGQVFQVEFRTLAPGRFVLRGSHVCGPPRRALDVTVQVVPKPTFEGSPALIRQNPPEENR